MVKCLPEYEYFTAFLKNKNIIYKIRRSKVTDYAALLLVLPTRQIFCSILRNEQNVKSILSYNKSNKHSLRKRVTKCCINYNCVMFSHITLPYAQVKHSRTGPRISHGYNPASFVAIRIGP